MFRVLILFLGAVLAAEGKPAAAPKPSTTVKKTTAAKPVVKKTSKKKPARPAARSYRQTQQKPTKDRYLEIEQALARRGYLSAEPTGDWPADAVEALKRFQQDQNLKADGRIDSLSLFALGLGPKRTAGLTPTSPE